MRSFLAVIFIINGIFLKSVYAISDLSESNAVEINQEIFEKTKEEIIKLTESEIEILERNIDCIKDSTNELDIKQCNKNKREEKREILAVKRELKKGQKRQEKNR